MKKKLLWAVALIIASSFLMTGCFSIGFFPATGPVKTQNYQFQGFNSIDVSSAIEFEIKQSDAHSLAISTQESVFSHLDIRQDGDTLVLRLKPVNATNTTIKAVITLPELRELDVSGAARGSAKGFKSAGEFELHQTDASRLEIDMETGKTRIRVSSASILSGNLQSQNTRFEISGASRCELSGSSGLTTIDVSGASQMRAPDFYTQDVTAVISGASQATVYTLKTLSVDLSGASSLRYRGNPILSKVDVTGASKLIDDD